MNAWSLTKGASRTALLLIVLATKALAADAISGVPRVVDGDTLIIGDTRIRLEGIDAPETDQVCLDQKGTKWTCGIAARDHLAEQINGRSIDCLPSGLDTYGRTLAVCRVAGENLNAWMVRQGWALAFIRYSTAYVADEASARDAQRGMWSGAFIAPWDWRHRNCKTEVRGAVMVPITSQPDLCDSSGAPDHFTIKGNLRSKSGECIYHLIGQLNYSHLDMSKSGRRWFCSEEKAKAAGCRPAAR